MSMTRIASRAVWRGVLGFKTCGCDGWGAWGEGVGLDLLDMSVWIMAVNLNTRGNRKQNVAE